MICFRSIPDLLSGENHLCKKALLNLMMDGVYLFHPFHLILRFQFFRYAFLCLHLAGQLFQPRLTDVVDFQQVFHERTGEQKLGIQSQAMFFEAAQAHPPISAQRTLLCFG